MKNVLVLAGLSLLAACGGSPTETPAPVEVAPVEVAPVEVAPVEVAPAEGVAAPAGAGWASVEGIFTANCAPCHNPGQSGGLKIAHETLVGVKASQAGMNRVTAGNADQSYLWHKLNGTQASVGGSGGIMPTKGKLAEGDLVKVKAWIHAGALQ